MKTIKNLLLTSSMLILSANVFANSSIYGDYSLHHGGVFQDSCHYLPDS